MTFLSLTFFPPWEFPRLCPLLSRSPCPKEALPSDLSLYSPSGLSPNSPSLRILRVLSGQLLSWVGDFARQPTLFSASWYSSWQLFHSGNVMPVIVEKVIHCSVKTGNNGSQVVPVPGRIGKPDPEVFSIFRHV